MVQLITHNERPLNGRKGREGEGEGEGGRGKERKRKRGREHMVEDKDTRKFKKIQRKGFKDGLSYPTS